MVIALLCNEDGWHEGAAEFGAGARYKFGIGAVSVPDPASRMQDQDVHDWSVVTDCSCYEWQHTAWSGKEIEGRTVRNMLVKPWPPRWQPNIDASLDRATAKAKEASENAKVAGEQRRFALDTLYTVVTKVDEKLRDKPDMRALQQETRQCQGALHKS